MGKKEGGGQAMFQPPRHTHRLESHKIRPDRRHCKAGWECDEQQGPAETNADCQ